MAIIATSAPQQNSVSTAASKPAATDKKMSAAAASGVVEVSDETSISTLAGRLSKAATATEQSMGGLDYAARRDKVLENARTIQYPFEGAAKAAAEKELPQPNDTGSAKSATAATAYLNGKAPNSFAGLSREQLAAISNDESGTFTINERRAASNQAYQEEESWRSQVVAQAAQEYNQTGKMTNFFKSVLNHFNELPAAGRPQRGIGKPPVLTGLSSSGGVRIAQAARFLRAAKPSRPNPMLNMR